MNRDFLLLVKFTAAIVILFVLIVYGTIAYQIRFVDSPANLARLEQLRADVARVDSVESEDVIGLAVEMNKDLAQVKSWNSVWFIDPMYPDWWDDVEPIEIPTR